jgi:hypothetical protein
MAINPDITVETIRDFINTGLMPRAVAQWQRARDEDPPNEATLQWIDGRVEAALEILQAIDGELFDAWVDTRNAQKALYTDD